MQPVLSNRPEIVGAEPMTMLQPIVRAIGVERAVDLFLNLGGSVVYIPERPKGRSRLAGAIGIEAVKALHRDIGRGHVRLPLANAWLAQQLAARGLKRADIGRLLRVTRSSLNGYLAKSKAVSW